MATYQKYLLYVLSLIAIGQSANSQNLPIYNHYFNNPFFYNSSYAGAKKHTEINLLYRQQRTSLSGAPAFSFITVTAPISKKIGIGLAVYNNTRGVITTNSAQAALSYKVQFNSKTYLRFGLATGLGKNSLDLDQVDVNDPVVARLLDNSIYLQGQAGINFQYQKLNIGFSMPQLFDQSIVNATTFKQADINPFNTTVSSISYQLQLGTSINFQPVVMYKVSEKNGRFEGYGIVHFKDIFWLGGMYRQNYGAAAMTGFQISNKLRLGYTYEFTTDQISQLAFNTHEFSLALIFGKQPKDTNDRSFSDKSKTVPAGLKQKKRKTKHY